MTNRDTIRTSPHEHDETAVIFPCGHATPDTCERCDRALIRRRGFLRGLVGATAAAVIAPKVLVQVPRQIGSITISGVTWHYAVDAEDAHIVETSLAFTAEWAVAR